MLRKLIFLSVVIASTHILSAQQFITRTGTIEFFSETPIEDIKAVNQQVSSVIDFAKNEFAFLVPIKAFAFEKALMQEHFNENYLESGEFPSSSFKGKITDADKLDLTTDGEYILTLKGTMALHGVEKEIEEKATFIVKGGKLSLISEFIIHPSDYDVKIPSSKQDNISDNIDVTVKMDYAKK